MTTDNQGLCIECAVPLTKDNANQFCNRVEQFRCDECEISRRADKADHVVDARKG